MQSDQKVRDLQAAEWIQQEHHRLRAEIEARQSEFCLIKDFGEELLAQKHFANAEIDDKIEHVVDTYDKVKKEWKLRNLWVEQVFCIIIHYLFCLDCCLAWI